MVKLICQNCRKEFYCRSRSTGKGRVRRFCSQACSSSSSSKHPNWKGGRSVPANPCGYISLYAPRHPRARDNHVHEHILIAEKALGHLLPQKAQVHHVDGNPQNNEPSNLVICEDQAFHKLLHARARRLKDTGSLDLKRCCACRQVKALELFGICSASWDNRRVEC